METALYLPVKRFLEKLGFEVKGEIRGCDMVALKGDGPPLVVVGELKLRFNLELVLQGVDRSAACDEVWLAVRSSTRGRERDARVRKLCRLLGFGLLGVSSRGRVEILVEPTRWRPRRDPKRRSQLVDEHRRRQGDPAVGGGTRAPIMTAYRQRALACAAALAEGARPVREMKNRFSGRARHPLAECLWLVRPGPARRLCADRGGPRGLGPLADRRAFRGNDPADRIEPLGRPFTEERMKELAGKVAFVTGAANGIGLGIARALAKEGVHVALADIERDGIERAAHAVEALGVRTLALPLDVSDRAAVEDRRAAS